MFEECATTTFVIAEPFDRAVHRVRSALAGARLRITGELNLSQRIQRRLLIQTPPCVVLFAAGDSEEENADVWVSPLHVVISDRGIHTEVHLLKVPERADGEAFRLPAKLQSVLSRALAGVGMRCPIGA